MEHSSLLEKEGVCLPVAQTHTHVDDEFEVVGPTIQGEAFSLEENEGNVVEAVEMLYDEEDFTKEERLRIMQEKKFIECWLNEGIWFGPINQVVAINEEYLVALVKSCEVKDDVEK